jgi:hypothetical protein
MVAGTAYFPDSFQELVRACSSFYKNNLEKISKEHVCQTRSRLSGFARVFHEQSGTLTASVKKRLEDLEDGRCIVLMTAHQPNFFPYSGVLRKATLNFLLGKKLEELLGVPVVNFFGIADQDFTDDRWVKSCQLPAVRRNGGILSIEAKLPERMMLNSVAKPSHDLVDGWKAQVERWLNETIKSVERLSKALGLAEVCSSSSFSALEENLKLSWNVVEDCFERSENYSDFNSFLISKIVNHQWEYDTVLARFSDCQQAFTEEFCFLLSHFKDYSRLLREAEKIESDESFGGGVSDQEPLLVPFWYHCDCGSKAKLFLTEKDGFLFGKGNCANCQRHYDLEFGPEDNPSVSCIASKISARAIPMSLIFFDGLLPSCYVGGVAGTRYLEEAQYVAKRLGILFPPIAFWRPRDKYAGVGQVEALLELRRICGDLGVQTIPEARDMLMCRISKVRGRLGEIEASKKRLIEELTKSPNDQELKERLRSVSMSQTETCRSSNLSVIHYELKVIENASTVSSLMPSIIDYAVNVGLKETSNQWIRHLCEKGSLESDVCLESVLSRNEKLDSALESLELL